jgi:hypothetical protein
MATKKTDQKSSEALAHANYGEAPSGYTNIIVSAQMQSIRLTVGTGNLLEANTAKVVPSNEFFNLSDSDWNSSNPRSIIGQYLKNRTDRQRDDLQLRINKTLRRSAESQPVGYPFGHTIDIHIKNDTLLFTNTVKYDLEKIKSRLQTIEKERIDVSSDIVRKSSDIELKFAQYRARFSDMGPMILQEVQDQIGLNHQIQRARKQLDHLHYKTQVHYDTFLMAIGQCVENILWAARQHRIERVAVPLLGAGWGG